MKHSARTIFFLFTLGMNAAICPAQGTPPPQPQPPPPVPAPSKPVKRVAALATPEADPQSWKLFSSAEGRFAVEFPGAPREDTQLVAVTGGQLRVHIHQLQTFAEYSVIYSDYPTATSSAEAAGRVLDALVRNAGRAVDATLLSSTEISIEGYPGRLLKERLPGGSILRAKFYLVGRRLYQIAITTPPEEGETDATIKFSDDAAWKFLGSFKLKPFVADAK